MSIVAWGSKIWSSKAKLKNNNQLWQKLGKLKSRILLDSERHMWIGNSFTHKKST